MPPPNVVSRTRLSDNPITDAGPYEAVVVSHLDPRMMGSLEVEILRHTKSGSTPLRSGQIVTVRYLSPFYGTTPVNGLTPNEGFQHTQKSYGMWMVPPDVGTRVLVIFAEGNNAYGYWIGCIPEQGMNFMIPGGGQAATELHRDDTPANLKQNKLPVGEYNKLIEKGEKVDPTLFKKPYNKDFTEVLEVQGLLGDEHRGTTTSSARREVPSSVFGISTPGPLDKRNKHPTAKYGAENEQIDHPFNRLGGSSFVMDDGDDKFVRATSAADGPPIYINKEKGEAGGDETIPQNELIRFRTRTGHQILMHNSEDFIYIANSRGTAWIELTSDGKIDVYAYDSISISSDEDINLCAERDINIDAGRNLNMRAQARYSDGKESENGIPSGRVQIESAFSTNVSAGKDLALSMKNNMHLAPDENFYIHVKGDITLVSDASIELHAKDSIHQRAENGSFYRQALRSIHDIVIDPDDEKKAMGYYLTAPSIDFKAGRYIHSTAGAEIIENAGASINNNAGTGIHLSAAAGVHLLGGSIVAGDAGVIHWNSGEAVDGTKTNAIQALKVRASNRTGDGTSGTKKGGNVSRPSTSEAPTKLRQITLPCIIPGAQNATTFDTICSRVPQHEPWPHHENLNPQGFKPDKTDREAANGLGLVNRVLTPDTFRKNLDGRASSVYVNIIGPLNIQAFGNNGCLDPAGLTANLGATPGGASGGGTGGAQGAPSSGQVNGYGGTPGSAEYSGQGALATITGGGRSVQVAKVFQKYFQGFINDLEATGYKITSLGGYCRRTTSKGRWSYHASGAAIDINPRKNPMIEPKPASGPVTDMPIDTVRALCKKWHLGWGGDWRSMTDAMHFSAAKKEYGGWDIPADGRIPTSITEKDVPGTITEGAPKKEDGAENDKEGIKEAEKAEDEAWDPPPFTEDDFSG